MLDKKRVTRLLINIDISVDLYEAYNKCICLSLKSVSIFGVS